MNSYNVEKSIDGISFKIMDYVTAKAGTENNYDIEDKKPFPGNSYYRLKMINTDGTFRYSNIVLIKTPTNSIYVNAMFPNPAKDLFTIEIYANNIQKLNISLFDFAGRRVLNQNETTKSGLQLIKLNLRSLPAGTYYAEVKTSGGILIQTTTFIKK